MTLKPVDKNQKNYHLFKLSTTLYALYDDEMDMPTQYGSLNKVDAAVTSLKKHIPGIFIVYYDRDIAEKTKLSFKKNLMKTRVNNTTT